MRDCAFTIPEGCYTRVSGFEPWRFIVTDWGSQYWHGFEEYHQAVRDLGCKLAYDVDVFRAMTTLDTYIEEITKSPAVKQAVPLVIIVHGFHPAHGKGLETQTTSGPQLEALTTAFNALTAMYPFACIIMTHKYPKPTKYESGPPITLCRYADDTPMGPIPNRCSRNRREMMGSNHCRILNASMLPASAYVDSAINLHAVFRSAMMSNAVVVQIACHDCDLSVRLATQGQFRIDQEGNQVLPGDAAHTRAAGRVGYINVDGALSTPLLTLPPIPETMVFGLRQVYMREVDTCTRDGVLDLLAAVPT